MPCTSYGSTSGVSLFWAIDPDPDLAIPATFSWDEVPFISESLIGKLTTSESGRITASRSYAGNAVTGGEVSGSIGYESEYCPFLNAMIKAALQASGAFAADSDTITNESTIGCFAFLKRVANGAGFDYYIYRGCQVDTLSWTISPGALIEGEVAVTGVRMGSGDLGAAAPANDVLTALPADWTLTNYISSDIMSSVFGLQNFSIQDSTPADIGVITNSVTVQFSNSLRAQQAVGTGTPWPAGVASGRFSATLSGDAFYNGPAIFNAMMANESLSATFDILNSAGQGWNFSMPYLKVSDAPPPNADSPDSDLIITSEFKAYQSATGTVLVTLIAP